MARVPLTIPGGHASVAERPALRTRHLALIIIAALLCGVGSSFLMMGERPPFGAVRIGVWQSYPALGSSDVDPYSRVLLARGPHLPLAAGEGVQFVARTDTAGAALSGRCRYRIAGATLPSRGWTLVVADRSGGALTGSVASAISDGQIVSDEAGTVAITASASISAGNWLALPADRTVSLILRFYDTTLSAGLSQVSQDALPRIERIGCA